MKIFAYQHNGCVAAVAVGDSINIYRVPARSIQPNDGEVTGEAMSLVVRTANAFEGHVNPDFRKALEGAIELLHREGR